MTIVAWALFIAALLANVLAVRALFARDRLAIWMRRCFVAAALLFCAIAITSFVVFITMPPLPSSLASEKARRLAEMISETINTAAFASLTCALPLVAGFVLHRRARRAENAP
jgi:hypothetical protein